MLRLPQSLIVDIATKSGSASSLRALSRVSRSLNSLLLSNEVLLRLYIQQQPHSCRRPFSGAYELLRWRPAKIFRNRNSAGCAAQRLLQLMLDYVSVAMSQASDSDATWRRARETAEGPEGLQADQIRQLMAVLPYSEHCLLPYCAAGGHVELVKALLPITQAVLGVGQCAVHYVKTSAFLAAAAGGQSEVLSELLSAGALTWASQMPGSSLLKTALDLAAQGGHLQAMQLLGQHVEQPTSHFLAAVTDSGSAQAMEWALGFWFSQFNATMSFSTAHVQQMHDALRVACHNGHLAAIRQLLRHLHAVRCHDCCVLALSYTASSSNTEAMRTVLESPYLPQQLSRGGPKLLQQLVMVVASCLRIAIRIHSGPSLQLLLDQLSAPGSALALVRPRLGPQMASVMDQAAAAGNGTALQLLLVHLPEHYDALGLSALQAALVEGHQEVAATIRMLLLLRGPEEGLGPATLSPDNNPAVAAAARLGAYKSAASRGDVAALQRLLAAGVGPDDNEQLVMLRLAAAAGHEPAVRLLLAEFGGGGGGLRAELCLRAVCRAAVHAGQLQLLQALAADSNSQLLAHLSGQADAMSEYLRAALLCGQVEVATFLVGLAAKQLQLSLVAATLHSLLTTSRWELWNCVGRSAREAVAALLKGLVAQAAPAECPAPPAAETEPVVVADTATALTVDVSSAPAPAAASFLRGDKLLSPQLLSLLLQASAGDPGMLYTVMDLVHASGLDGHEHSRQHHQQQQSKRQEVCLSGEGSSSNSDTCEVHDKGLSSSRSAGSSASANTAVTSSYVTVSSRSSSISCSGELLLGASDPAVCARPVGLVPDQARSKSWPAQLMQNGSASTSDSAVLCVVDRPLVPGGQPGLPLFSKADGVVSVMGSGSSGGKSPSSSVAGTLMPHPSSPLTRRCLQQQPQPVQEAVGLKQLRVQQLLGQVQQLSVSPDTPQQQEQARPQHTLRRGSNPHHCARPEVPLRTALSMPTPRASQPQHPYMQQYSLQRQQQLEQQQQQQQQQLPPYHGQQQQEGCINRLL